MMAVGLTRAGVRTLFLLEALMLGALGAISGLVLSALMTFGLARRGIHFTPPSATMPIDVYPFLTVGFSLSIAVVAMLGAVVFALYPAIRASRLRPVEALAGR